MSATLDNICSSPYRPSSSTAFPLPLPCILYCSSKALSILGVPGADGTLLSTVQRIVVPNCIFAVAQATLLRRLYNREVLRFALLSNLIFNPCVYLGTLLLVAYDGSEIKRALGVVLMLVAIWRARMVCATQRRRPPSTATDTMDSLPLSRTAQSCPSSSSAVHSASRVPSQLMELTQEEQLSPGGCGDEAVVFLTSEQEERVDPLQLPSLSSAVYNAETQPLPSPPPLSQLAWVSLTNTLATTRAALEAQDLRGLGLDLTNGRVLLTIVLTFSSSGLMQGLYSIAGPPMMVFVTYWEAKLEIHQWRANAVIYRILANVVTIVALSNNGVQLNYFSGYILLVVAGFIGKGGLHTRFRQGNAIYPSPPLAEA